MTRIFILLTIFITSLAASAHVDITPSSNYVTHTVPVNFSRISRLETKTAIDIEYTDAPTQKVQIYAPENLAKYVRVSHEGTTLSVSYNQSISIHGNCTVKIMVSAPDVTSFVTYSSGDILIKNSFNRSGKTVSLTTSSAGDIKGYNITAQQINLKTNSAGDIRLSTIKCNSASLYTNSSGDIRVDNITASSVSVQCNSAGDIYTNKIVCNQLSAASQSAGDVNIAGANCEYVSAISSSSGDVKISGITASIVEARSGSAGDIILSGMCNNAELSASSSSDIIASSLKAKTVKATTNSSVSSISCYAIERFEANKARHSTIKNHANGHSTTIVTYDD